MTLISILAVTASMMIGQPGSQPTRIAVVNIPVISEKYTKTKDLETSFDARRKELNIQRDAKRDKIERLQRSLREELKPGTDTFIQRQKELVMAEAEMQWFVDFESIKVERGLADALRGIYQDIQTIVREVANDSGIDVVLSSDFLPESLPESSAQLRQQILLQKVVYFNPRLDITDEVVIRLNAKYESQKRNSGVGSAAPLVPSKAYANADTKPQKVVQKK